MVDLDRERRTAKPVAYERDGDETGGFHEVITAHVRRFFGAQLKELVWTVGPKGKVPRRFRVLEVPPSSKTACWSYVSAGAWELSEEGNSLEFVLLTPRQAPRAVELVTMVATYQRSHPLGVGHSLPIGEPWLDDSSCDHFLICSPYPLGPDFEVCPVGKGHVHILWMLPITRAERDFKVKSGLEALEQLFDRVALDYWNPRRGSVVE
jgi:hypothetical protein